MDAPLFVIEESEEYFGPFYPFVKDIDITDIDYNGRELWITRSNSRREKINNVIITADFVEQFTKRVSNTVSLPFHKHSPVLEAETDTLRITIVHESVAISGRSICIRKSMPYVRMTEESMVQSGYCTKEILALLKNCVKARMNMVFAGEPGAGKTELGKFFSKYIPACDRVITIEDTPEWHYSRLNPGKDCVELKISDRMDYTKAIKTCLRLNPRWMFVSEVRSKEVIYLLESFSTGVRGFTTLHTDDVRKVPDRMLNMSGINTYESRLENDIFSFIDVAVLIRKQDFIDSEGKASVRRFIDQVCFFCRENGVNTIAMIYESNTLLNPAIPDSVKKRMQTYGIEDLYSFREEAGIEKAE